MDSKLFYHLQGCSSRILKTARLAAGGPTLVEAVGIEPTSEQGPWKGLLVEYPYTP